MNTISTREMLDTYSERCIALNMENSSCGFSYVIDEQNNYILTKYVGDYTEVHLNDMFDMVDSSAFSGTAVEFIDFGIVQKIGNCACMNCQNLKYVKALNCITLHQDTFKDCFTLEKIEFEKLQLIGPGSFCNCYSLKEIAGLDYVKKCGVDSFKLCVQLESIRLPKITQLEKNVFNNCHSLKNLQIDEVKSISKRALSHCYKLESLCVPKLRMLSTVGLYGNISLNKIVLGNKFEGGYDNLKDLKNLKLIIFYGKQQDMVSFKNIMESKGIYVEYELVRK